MTANSYKLLYSITSVNIIRMVIVCENDVIVYIINEINKKYYSYSLFFIFFWKDNKNKN